MVVMGLALTGCGAPVPAAQEKAVTVLASQTVVVRETVLVPQTVVMRETVAVPQTVVVRQTVSAPAATSAPATPRLRFRNVAKVKDSTDQVQELGGVALMVDGISLFDWAEGQKLEVIRSNGSLISP